MKRRSAVSNTVAVSLLVVGLVIGATGFYVATTYQTKLVVITTTQSTTTSFTETVTQPLTFISTTLKLSTTTTTTTSVTVSSTSVYPVPSNVTLVFWMVDGEYQFTISSATYNNAGSLAGANKVVLTNLFQGETVTISAYPWRSGVGCAVGEHFTMDLWVNGHDVSSSASTGCGSTATITYTV